jgi:Fe2+ or Zn2+ uptake regulation protein
MADDPAVVAAIEAFDAQRGFAVNVSHLTMVGRCATCQGDG